MMRKSSITKQKIIESAMGLALKQGFAATSVDEVIGRAGINKGAFFYHFKSKKDLATALISQFSDEKLRTLDENMERANRLNKNPLEQLLIFVGLIQELNGQSEKSLIGCLYASYSYENQLEDEDLLSMATSTLNEWKNQLSKKFEEIISVYPPHFSVNPDELAESFLVTLEGAYVMSRIMNKPGILQLHLEQYKIYLESLFRVR